MKNLFVASALILSLSLASNVFAQTIPTSSNLSASYSGATGILRVVNRFDRAPSQACTLRIRASVSYEGMVDAESIRTVYQKSFRKRRIDLRVTGLNAVPLDGDGNRPQLNLQSTLTCRSGRIVSDAEAVFVVCGRGTSEVSPKNFLRTLGRKIADLNQ